MKLSKDAIEYFEPYVMRAWDAALDQAKINSTVVLNPDELRKKALKRMRYIYPDELLRAHGIHELEEKLKKN